MVPDSAIRLAALLAAGDVLADAASAAFAAAELALAALLLAWTERHGTPLADASAGVCLVGGKHVPFDPAKGRAPINSHRSGGLSSVAGTRPTLYQNHSGGR